MSNVTFLSTGSPAIEAEIFQDATLMELALINDVPGILGLCGGICSCATCHVHVAEEWIDRLPPASAEERDMLDALTHATRGSRLGCQVRLDDSLGGLVVTVAEAE